MDIWIRIRKIKDKEMKQKRNVIENKYVNRGEKRGEMLCHEYLWHKHYYPQGNRIGTKNQDSQFDFHVLKYSFCWYLILQRKYILRNNIYYHNINDFFDKVDTMIYASKRSDNDQGQRPR